MSRFIEVVKPETPRLVVQYRMQNGIPDFGWGVFGNIHTLSLIGVIGRVQADLAAGWADECPEPALVIAWNTDPLNPGKPEWFVNPAIPLDPLLGMLETIKAVVVASHIAKQNQIQQMQAKQNLVIGLDGKPYRG